MAEGVDDRRPIILTAQFDVETQDFFEAQRRQYFPPALNKIPAHLTLFHNLPGAEEAAVIQRLAEAMPGAPVAAMVTGLMKMGRGTAYRIESEGLSAFRSRLAAAFKPWLIVQDRQGFRPHVTIQNKVTAQEAVGLYSHLSATFEPFAAMVEGVQVWRYDGGPWVPLGALAFFRS
ncbi:MAG: 2'-5' RNA ligase family protein [Pseudomonadota bacterium]